MTKKRNTQFLLQQLHIYFIFGGLVCHCNISIFLIFWFSCRFFMCWINEFIYVTVARHTGTHWFHRAQANMSEAHAKIQWILNGNDRFSVTLLSFNPYVYVNVHLNRVELKKKTWTEKISLAYRVMHLAEGKGYTAKQIGMACTQPRKNKKKK